MAVKRYNGTAWVTEAGGQIDSSLLQTKAATGLNIVVPTSISLGGGSGSVSANGAVNFTGVTSVMMNGIFTTDYDNYQIILTLSGISVTSNLRGRLCKNGGGNNTFYYVQEVTFQSTTVSSVRTNNTNAAYLGAFDTGYPGTRTIDVQSPRLNRVTQMIGMFNRFQSGLGNSSGLVASDHQVVDTFDGFQIYPDSGNITGTIRVYGYNNGA